jgi:hypothetical protein
VRGLEGSRLRLRRLMFRRRADDLRFPPHPRWRSRLERDLHLGRRSTLHVMAPHERVEHYSEEPVVIVRSFGRLLPLFFPFHIGSQPSHKGHNYSLVKSIPL